VEGRPESGGAAPAVGRPPAWSGGGTGGAGCGSVGLQGRGTRREGLGPCLYKRGARRARLPRLEAAAARMLLSAGP
jgi:hypothetical protein